MFSLTIFSDRFRTAINVFGDSIGCAIVQHLSRKELQSFASEENTTTLTYTNKSNTILPTLISDADRSLGVSNGPAIHPSNGMLSTAYDNLTFTSQTEIHNDDNHETRDQTKFNK